MSHIIMHIRKNKNKGLSVYKYLENAEFSNTAFDNYKELNGDGTFRATNDEGTKLENATASITSTSKWETGRFLLKDYLLMLQRRAWKVRSLKLQMEQNMECFMRIIYG